MSVDKDSFNMDEIDAVLYLIKKLLNVWEEAPYPIFLNDEDLKISKEFVKDLESVERKFIKLVKDHDERPLV